MSLKEIQELMLLRDWKRGDLAEALGLCENTVARWFCKTASGRRKPGPAECQLMRLWLTETRRRRDEQSSPELQPA